MMSTVPIVKSTGTYESAPPWALSPTVQYTCVAVRAFSEFSKQNINVYDTFYKPMGVDTTKFAQDTKDAVVMVALESQLGELVYIPSSYILKMPTVSGVNYAHRVLTMSLGMLPDTMDLTSLKDSVRGLIEARLGVLSDVNEAMVPFVGVVTDSEHFTLEQGRAGRITEPTTDRGQIDSLTKKNLALQEQVNTLLAAALANNLVQTQ